LLERLRESDKRVSLVVTGGGTGAVARCFRREGASRNFVEAVIPYSREALADYLGSEPADSVASGPVARQVAAVALDHTYQLADDDVDCRQAAGVALVAALPTTPQRRGQDRIHVALCTHERQVLWSLELPKHAYSRQRAETIADEMVYRALAELCHDAESSEDDRFFDETGLRLVRTCFEN
jgi:hypothetical protein